MVSRYIVRSEPGVGELGTADGRPATGVCGLENWTGGASREPAFGKPAPELREPPVPRTPFPGATDATDIRPVATHASIETKLTVSPLSLHPPTCTPLR